MKYLRETYKISQKNNEISEENQLNMSRKPRKYLKENMKYLKETHEISQGNLRNIIKKQNEIF